MVVLSTFLKRAGIGFLLGMVAGNLICVICGYVQTGTAIFFAPEFAARAGSELNAMVLQILLSGLYGAVCMGSNVLYDAERLPLLYATVIHYLLVMLLYIPLSLFLCWITSAADMLIVMAFMSIAYVFIWMSMYISYKIQIKKLNELQEEYLIAINAAAVASMRR